MHSFVQSLGKYTILCHMASTPNHSLIYPPLCRRQKASGNLLQFPPVHNAKWFSEVSKVLNYKCRLNVALQHFSPPV